MYIDIDLSQAKRLERILAGIRQRSVGFAIKNTLNDLAFLARRNLVDKIDHDFTNRNTWTKRSIRVERARYTGDFSEVGSTEDYMSKQEFGGRGEKYIATGNASGEGGRVKVRQRAVRASNWINKLSARKFPEVSGSRQRKRVAALHMAKRENQKYVVLENDQGDRGLYRVLGTKKRPKSKLLYMLRKSPVQIKKHQWLQPTTERVQREQVGTLYFLRLRQELARAMRG